MIVRFLLFAQLGTTKWRVLLFAAALAAHSAQAQADRSGIADAPVDKVLVSTEQVAVTANDVTSYLNFLAFTQGNTLPRVSQQRLSQAIIELYALRTLDHDAEAAGVLADEDTAWFADYLLAMERVKFYLRSRVEEMLDATDWEQEAFEYYLARKNDFFVSEMVDVRTLLLKPDGRPLSETLELMDSLVTPDMTLKDFERVVRNHTDDSVAAKTGGLMEGVKKGQTVPPFEQAAFALKEPGEIASPVVSQFGVHAIQLLGKTPARQKSFDEAKDEIIAKLVPLRTEEYFDALRGEAKAREPESFQIDEQAIEAFMAQLGEGSPTRLPIPGN